MLAAAAAAAAAAALASATKMLWVYLHQFSNIQAIMAPK